MKVLMNNLDYWDKFSYLIIFLNFINNLKFF